MIKLKPNWRELLTTPDVAIAARRGISSPAEAQEANLGEKACSARSAGVIGRSI